MKVEQRGMKTIEGEQEVMNFTSIEQANNWLDDYDKTYKKENFERFDNAGATTAPRKDRIKYIDYAISLLNPKYEKESLLLTLRTRGYPIERIAQELGTTVKDVQESEAVAMKRVQDEIARRKATCIPIIGGC